MSKRRVIIGVGEDEPVLSETQYDIDVQKKFNPNYKTPPDNNQYEAYCHSSGNTSGIAESTDDPDNPYSYYIKQ